jgi:hypothetical protein
MILSSFDKFSGKTKKILVLGIDTDPDRHPGHADPYPA